MAPALTAVEMEEGAMLCTSGGLGEGENFDNEGEEELQSVSEPIAPSTLWDEEW